MRTSTLWNDDIPFDDKVVVKYPLNATEDTPEITGLSPDIIILAENESMRQHMTELKAELKASFELTLIEQLNQRDVGGSGFARGNEIAEKLNAILDKVADLSHTTQVSAGVSTLPAMDGMSELEESGGLEYEEEEEDIVLQLDEPARMPPRKRARLVHQLTQQQIAKRTMKVGFHHGHFSPLPASWRYPKGLTVIQLINLWLIGSPKESVPPLGKLNCALVKHINKRGMNRSKMKALMGQVEHFARLDDVWIDGRWTGPDVTRMWSTIWPRLDPFLRTNTIKKNGEISVEKSRQGQMSWRTCFNKLSKHLVEERVERERDGIVQ